MLFCSALVLALSVAIANPLSGRVVDSSGRAIPRARVDVVATDGAIATSVFTDLDGTFRVQGAPDGCRVRVSLTGFHTTTADCPGGTPLTLTLPIAGVAENIVVSATRTEAPSGQVASAVTVFDEAEIERRQAPPLAELLRSAPGTTVVRVGAPGAVTSLFVRAGESNYTKVLLDGIPLNEPGGAFNLSNITTENLDRIEFVRGANSAVHGSDAMTGVIQLFTRRGRTPRPEFRLRAEGGSFSTTRGSAGLSAKAGRVDYSADVTGVGTANEVPNNRFRNATLSGSAGAELGRGASLRFVARAERGKTGVPGQTAFGRPDRDAFFQRHDSVWGTSFDQHVGALHHRVSYGLAASDQASTNMGTDPAYRPAFEGRTAPFEFSDFPYDTRSKLRRHHASYQVDGTISTRAGTHVDTALVEWDGQRATLRDALAGASVPASRNNVGISFQHQALWSRVFVTGGIRFERNASFGTATTPRVAIAWYARTGNGAIGSTRLSASAGRAIKEPTLLQSFSPNPFFLGNPDLQPERIDRALEAGVEQRVAADRVRVAVTWFDNRYRNIIATRTVSFSPFVSQFFNIGLTTARGAELTADVVLASGFRAKTGYTFTDSEIVETTSTSAVFAVGNPAFRRPRHSGFVNLAWHGARGSIDLAGSLVGERVDSDFASLVPAITVNERYTSWDLRASARLTRAFSLTAAIDNLTDSDRMEPLGYPVLGRAIRFGVRARF